MKLPPYKFQNVILLRRPKQDHSTIKGSSFAEVITNYPALINAAVDQILGNNSDPFVAREVRQTLQKAIEENLQKFTPSYPPKFPPPPPSIFRENLFTPSTRNKLKALAREIADQLQANPNDRSDCQAEISFYRLCMEAVFEKTWH